MDQHNSFSYRWVCGRESCTATFSWLRKEDHPSNHHGKKVEKRRGERSYSQWAMDKKEEDKLHRRAESAFQVTRGEGSQNESEAKKTRSFHWKAALESQEGGDTSNGGNRVAEHKRGDSRVARVKDAPTPARPDRQRDLEGVLTQALSTREGQTIVLMNKGDGATDQRTGLQICIATPACPPPHPGGGNGEGDDIEVAGEQQLGQ